MFRPICVLGSCALATAIAISSLTTFSKADDKAGSCDPPAAAHPIRPKVLAKMQADNLELSDKAVRRVLEPVASANEKTASFRALISSLAAGKRLYLVLKDFRTNAQPGVLYAVYLDLPNNPSKEMEKEHFVGIVNFFNARPMSNATKHEKSPGFVSFDITRLVKGLAAAGTLEDKPVVTIVPAGTPVIGSKPLITEISVVEQ